MSKKSHKKQSNKKRSNKNNLTKKYIGGNNSEDKKKKYEIYRLKKIKNENKKFEERLKRHNKKTQKEEEKRIAKEEKRLAKEEKKLAKEEKKKTMKGPTEPSLMHLKEQNNLNNTFKSHRLPPPLHPIINSPQYTIKQPLRKAPVLSLSKD